MLLHSPLLQQSLLLALPPLSDMLKLGGSLPAPQATEQAALRQPHTNCHHDYYDWPWLDGLPVLVLWFVRAHTSGTGTLSCGDATTTTPAPGATLETPLRQMGTARWPRPRPMHASWSYDGPPVPLRRAPPGEDGIDPWSVSVLWFCLATGSFQFALPVHPIATTVCPFRSTEAKPSHPGG